MQFAFAFGHCSPDWPQPTAYVLVPLNSLQCFGTAPALPGPPQSQFHTAPWRQGQWQSRRAVAISRTNFQKGKGFYHFKGKGRGTGVKPVKGKGKSQSKDKDKGRQQLRFVPPRVPPPAVPAPGCPWDENAEARLKYQESQMILGTRSPLSLG